MAPRNRLTNEQLKGLFKSNFNLANYAIKLARYYVLAGHEITLDAILLEVQKHPDESHLQDLIDSESSESEE